MASLPENLDWLALEHNVATILAEQEFYGWAFDVDAARELDSELEMELRSLDVRATTLHPLVPDVEFTPKRNNKTKGYVAGAPFTKLIDFNSTSRDQIAWVLKTHYGWKPEKETESGKTAVDELTLKEFGSEEALMFASMLELTKQRGLLSQGKNAWLKLVRDGRIHHSCSVGAQTHRCAHRNPNLSQVPSDLRFRRLFTASPNMVMVGADLSGIELRMLGHYLARYDGGRYADILVNGDIHQVNADKIGITRKAVKTVTYAFLYGAGDAKIGHSYDSSLDEKAAAKKGREIRKAFVEAIDGLAELLAAVQSRAKSNGRIKAIDGRPIAVDSPHKALNYLLQSSAGVVAKRWMDMANLDAGMQDIKCHQLAFIHDELQFDCRPDHADRLAECLEVCATDAGEYYNLRVPIAAESKRGVTWADVH